MTNYLKSIEKKLSNKKNIIFDLDGVLIDSLKNMETSWSLTNKKFSLNISFDKYCEYIGKPFKEILKSLGVKKIFFSLVEKEFRKKSLKNLHKIKFYPSTYRVLRYLKRKNYFLGILTSKDKLRTKKILKKLNIKFDTIQCPETNYKGKPHPDLIKKIIKNHNLKKLECVYIGDTIYDKQMCQKAKVDFIFAEYGFRIGIKNYKYKIKKFLDIKKIF